MPSTATVFSLWMVTESLQEVLSAGGVLLWSGRGQRGQEAIREGGLATRDCIRTWAFRAARFKKVASVWIM